MSRARCGEAREIATLLTGPSPPPFFSSPIGELNGASQLPAPAPPPYGPSVKLFPFLAAAAALAVTSCGDKGEAAPKIVKEELIALRGNYEVHGSIHNPSKYPMKDVEVRYLVWGQHKVAPGGDDLGMTVKRTGGEVKAAVKYLPPGETVEFKAVGAEEVPVYDIAKPEPLKAEIKAAWAE